MPADSTASFGLERELARARVLHRRLGIILTAHLMMVTAHAGAASPGLMPKTPTDSASFFGLTNVWTIHLKVTFADWTAMERSIPGIGMRPFAIAEAGPRIAPLEEPILPRPANPPRRDQIGFPRGNPPYVTAAVEIAGQRFEKVGLRFKGNSSLMSGDGRLKRPFKIDFNRFVKTQKFLGLTKICLNNNAMDPSQIREALSYDIFRAAGVASSRTAFAKVYLTVPGAYERQYLGLYTIVEQVDDRFLLDRFGSKKGLLVKPNGGLQDLGDNWSAYQRPYEAKNEPTPEEAKRFIKFIKLLNSDDDLALRNHLEEFMDVDQFLRFLAVTVAIADMDSVLGMGHNFYLFQPAKMKPIVWIPWDLNLSLGSGNGGMELSIRHPVPPHNRVVERILKDEPWFTIYKGHLQSILNSAFQPERVLRRVEQLRAVLREPIALESPAHLDQFERAVFGGTTNTPPPVNRPAPVAVPPGAPARLVGQRFFFDPGGGRGLPLTKWIPARAESLTAQLAGKSEGKPPATGGPGMMGGMRFLEPGGRLAEQFFPNAGVRPDTKCSRESFRQGIQRGFQRWDTDRRGTLTEAEVIAGVRPAFGPPPEIQQRQAQGRALIRQLMPEFPGPEHLHGPQLFRRIDTDRNGMISLIEWGKAFDTWFGEWDTSKDGFLQPHELSYGFMRVLMGPPDRAFPGGPPGAQQFFWFDHGQGAPKPKGP